MIFTFVCPQAGLDSNDANDASRAGDLRRAASAEADTLPSSSGMPTLRCRLSGEPTIGSGMWRPHVIRASEPSRARVCHRSMLHFLRSVKGSLDHHTAPHAGSMQVI